MTSNKTSSPELSYEESKAVLITRGTTQREGLSRSINIVRANLHADRIAKNAVNHLTNAAFNTVENMFNWSDFRSGNFGKLLPLAATVYSIVTRRKLVGPILRGSAIVVAATAGALVWWRHKQRTKSSTFQTDVLVPSDELANYPEYIDAGSKITNLSQYKQ